MKDQNESLFKNFLEIKEENRHLKTMMKDAKLEVEALKIQLKKSARLTQNLSNFGDRSDFQEDVSSLSAQQGDLGKVINKVGTLISLCLTLT